MKRFLHSAAIAAALPLSACVSPIEREAELVGTWLVEDVSGRGAIDFSRVDLTFASDGKLSGSTGCNRFSGTYRVNGSHMTIGTLATTRMACAEALMNQEAAFVEAVSSISQFTFDATGALLLKNDDRTLVLARRDGQ